MCLKPTLLLWLAAIFLCRAVTLPITVGIGHIAGVNSGAMVMLRDYWNEDQLIPAVFAVPVLYALCRRVPTAAAAVRWLWARGQLLLSLSAGLDLALQFAVKLWNRELPEQPGVLLTAAIDVYFLAYILAARRVRDTFLDFPPRLMPPEGPSGRR